MTTVPGLRGLRLSAAVQRLVRAHLRVTVQYVRSPRRRGSVLSQQPAGGHKIAQANRVEVNVSASGSARFRAVPDVLTATRVRAAKLVRNAGFVPLVVLVRSGDAQRGLVLDVQPAGASAAPAGAEIVLLVGAGARG
jgi:beta-lactam-binding protein with PASTA domain